MEWLDASEILVTLRKWMSNKCLHELIVRVGITWITIMNVITATIQQQKEEALIANTMKAEQTTCL